MDLGSPDPERRTRQWALGLLILTVLVIAVIVLWPGPPDPSGQDALVRFFNRAHRHGLPRWIGYNLVQNLSNMLMFAPVGLLGSLAARHHNWWVVPAAALGSTAIEMAQLLFLPGRVATLSDILANTGGTLIGFLLSVPALRRRSGRQRRAALGLRGAADRRPRTPGQPLVLRG